MARTGPSTARKLRLGWLNLIARRRRWIVAALLGIATLSGLRALTPPTVATERIWIAAHQLSGGEPIRAADVAIESMPLADVPNGAFSAGAPIAGSLLAGPAARGQPITRLDLLDSQLLSAIAPGDVATAIHVADAGSVTGLVQPGQRVDVLATPTSDAGGGGAMTASVTVARALRVISVPTTAASSAGDSSGATVIVAASPSVAATLAAAQTADLISVSVNSSR